MLNLMQLLELVVANPNRSACDMRLIVHIWEAFTKWCAEQFDQHTGVKFLGLGEFTMRHDIIGNMDFWNPMFALSEGFARAHGLHDRRPKAQSTAVAGRRRRPLPSADAPRAPTLWGRRTTARRRRRRWRWRRRWRRRRR